MGISGAFIEFLIVSDDNLLIGTREGHLIMYNVPSVFDDSHKLELLRHSKNFNKKRINQIDVVPEYNLLIILTGISQLIRHNVNLFKSNISALQSDCRKITDNIVCIHDLNSPNFQQICQLPKTRGATLFTLDIQSTQSLTGEKNTVVRLCVAVKRKLQLYYWKGKKFEEFKDFELTVPDIPRQLSW